MIVPIPISSEQKQENCVKQWSPFESFYKNILRRKRGRVRACRTWEIHERGGGDRNLFSLFVSQSLSSKRKEKIFLRFWWNHGWKPFNFHNRNLFISENNAIVKFITSAGVRVETRARFMPISVSNQLQDKHIFVGITFDRNDYSIKTKLSSDGWFRNKSSINWSIV